MASVYFVAVTSNAAEVYKRALETYAKEAVYRLADDKFFVQSDDTSMDVSKKIGVRDGTLGSGLVLRVTTYNGRASSSLWEWLAPRLEK
jgi:hypothetical protein